MLRCSLYHAQIDENPDLDKIGNIWDAVPTAKSWTALDPIPGKVLTRNCNRHSTISSLSSPLNRGIFTSLNLETLLLKSMTKQAKREVELIIYYKPEDDVWPNCCSYASIKIKLLILYWYVRTYKYNEAKCMQDY